MSHTVQYFFDVTVACTKSVEYVFQRLSVCPSASPSVSPQTVQVLGAVQVASIQLCPRASPCVFPHLLQVSGVVHVAATHSWWHMVEAAITVIKRSAAIMETGTIHFLRFFGGSLFSGGGVPGIVVSQFGQLVASGGTSLPQFGQGLWACCGSGVVFAPQLGQKEAPSGISQLQFLQVI